MCTTGWCDGISKRLERLTTDHTVGDGDANKHCQLEGQQDLLATAFAWVRKVRKIRKVRKSNKIVRTEVKLTLFLGEHGE